MRFEKKELTIGELYGPAMEVKTAEEAAEYYEALIDWMMTYWHEDRAKAEGIVKQNLGYFAGYYDHETRLRVEELYNCQHPVFGAASAGAPTPEEAFEAGKRMAEESK
jgi:hypothetical protein